MFMYLAFQAPHAPMQVPSEYLDRTLESRKRKIFAGWYLSKKYVRFCLHNACENHDYNECVLLTRYGERCGWSRWESDRFTEDTGTLGQYYSHFFYRWGRLMTQTDRHTARQTDRQTYGYNRTIVLGFFSPMNINVLWFQITVEVWPTGPVTGHCEVRRVHYLKVALEL